MFLYCLFFSKYTHTSVQDVYVHCTYNCGRTYRTMRYPLDKKAWHKTLRKLNAHESQRCPLRQRRDASSKNSQKQQVPKVEKVNAWDSITDDDSFWKSPMGGGGIIGGNSTNRFWGDAENGRKRQAVTDNKRAATTPHHGEQKGPSYNRLMEARERLKSLEQNMSTLRHSSQMSKARFVSERASLIEENQKLEAAVKTLVLRAEDKMTDEHIDDFVALASRIEQARSAKDNELKRVQMQQNMLMQESMQERQRRQSLTQRAVEEERRRRMQNQSHAQRLSQHFSQTLKLSEQVPMQF